MTIKDVIGCKIEDIYQKIEFENYGLDRGDCIIELDNGNLIEIPYRLNLDFDENIIVKNFDEEFSSILKNTQHQNWLSRFFHSKEESPIRKCLMNKKIVNLIYYLDEFTFTSDYIFLVLENGYIISKTTTAPNGLGIVGLNIYDSEEQLQLRHGIDEIR